MTHSEKTQDIIKVITETAKALTKAAKVAFPKKRMFAKGKFERTPSKRIKKKQAKAAMYMIPFIGAAQIHLIQSRPIPKHNFPSGGGAYVGERGPEIIEVNGKMVLIGKK